MKRIINLIPLIIVFLLLSCSYGKSKKSESKSDKSDVVQNKVDLSKKPNIIFIYADDMGRGMLSTYGQKLLTTPHIDKLANEGMRFNNVYGCNYCAPARASLLTGMNDCHKHQWTVTKGGIYEELGRSMTLKQITDSINSVAMPALKNEVFMAQVAQKAGYNTAEFGKLEWGFATTAQRIKRHGWDYHFGYYDHQRCHGFYPPFLFENGKEYDIPGNTRVDCGKNNEYESKQAYKVRWDMTGKKVYSEYLIEDKMMAYMDSHNPKKTGKPMFIYFPTQLAHGPIAVPKVDPELKDNPKLTEFEKEYGTMVKILDNGVGKVVAKCKELGILDNTIIVFSGDNGHEIYAAQKGRCEKGTKDLKGVAFDNIKTKYYSDVNGDVFNGNDGMAGLKRDNWEGGVRVPLIWYWKGKIKAGTTSTQLVANYDLLNTFAELMGQPQVKGKDGTSYAKTLLGGHSKEHYYVVYESIHSGSAIVTREGWKLRMQKDKKNNKIVYQLYYLPKDYREEHELSVEYPAKVVELKKILTKENNRE